MCIKCTLGFNNATSFSDKYATQYFNQCKILCCIVLPTFCIFYSGAIWGAVGGVKVKQAPRNTFPKFIYHSNTRKIHVDEIEGERERGANWATATFLKKL